MSGLIIGMALVNEARKNIYTRKVVHGHIGLPNPKDVSFVSVAVLDLTEGLEMRFVTHYVINLEILVS